MASKDPTGAQWQDTAIDCFSSLTCFDDVDDVTNSDVFSRDDDDPSSFRDSLGMQLSGNRSSGKLVNGSKISSLNWFSANSSSPETNPIFSHFDGNLKGSSSGLTKKWDSETKQTSSPFAFSWRKDSNTDKNDDDDAVFQSSSLTGRREATTYCGTWKGGYNNNITSLATVGDNSKHRNGEADDNLQGFLNDISSEDKDGENVHPGSATDFKKESAITNVGVFSPNKLVQISSVPFKGLGNSNEIGTAANGFGMSREQTLHNALSMENEGSTSQKLNGHFHSTSQNGNSQSSVHDKALSGSWVKVLPSSPTMLTTTTPKRHSLSSDPLLLSLRGKVKVPMITPSTTAPTTTAAMISTMRRKSTTPLTTTTMTTTKSTNTESSKNVPLPSSTAPTSTTTNLRRRSEADVTSRSIADIKRERLLRRLSSLREENRIEQSKLQSAREEVLHEINDERRKDRFKLDLLHNEQGYCGVGGEYLGGGIADFGRGGAGEGGGGGGGGGGGKATVIFPRMTWQPAIKGDPFLHGSNHKS